MSCEHLQHVCVLSVHLSICVCVISVIFSGMSTYAHHTKWKKKESLCFHAAPVQFAMIMWQIYYLKFLNQQRDSVSCCQLHLQITRSTRSRRQTQADIQSPTSSSVGDWGGCSGSATFSWSCRGLSGRSRCCKGIWGSWLSPAERQRHRQKKRKEKWE